MVLSISDYNDSPALLTLRTESSDCSIDRFADRCSLHRHRLGRNRVQEHLGGNVISSDRQLHERISGKYNKTDPIITKFIDQP